MSKDIHEVQMDVMEWMEITDLKEMIRQSNQTENERKIAMQADTLNAVVLALRCRVHIPLELHADSDCICMTVSNGTACLSDLNCIYF